MYAVTKVCSVRSTTRWHEVHPSTGTFFDPKGMMQDVGIGIFPV
jgi:hypothetical protein